MVCISMNELYSEFSELGLSNDLVCSVTFSRLEPEGKLVMGFRKSSTVPTDQVWFTFFLILDTCMREVPQWVFLVFMINVDAATIHIFIWLAIFCIV